MMGKNKWWNTVFSIACSPKWNMFNISCTCIFIYYMIWYDIILFYLFMFVSISQNGMTPSSLDICGSLHPGDSRCTGFQRTGGRVR
jgi:hypothetical protein